MKLVTSLVVAAVVAVGLTAAAPDKKAARPDEKKEGMAPPPMPAEGKRLVEGMLGKWKSSDVAMTMGDQKLTGKMSLDCEKASGGRGALCKARTELKGQPPVEDTYLFAWDLGGAKGHMFEVGGMGEVHDHSGAWSDDKTLSLVHEGKTPDGKDEKDTVTFSWASPKELTVKAEGVQGGAVVWSMTSTAKK